MSMHSDPLIEQDARSEIHSVESPGSGVRVDARERHPPALSGIEHLRGAAAILLVYFSGVLAFASGEHSRAFSDRAYRFIAPDPVSALVAEGHTALSLFIVAVGFTLAFGATGKQVDYRGFLADRFSRTYPAFLFILIVGTSVHRATVGALPLLQTAFGGANIAGAQQLGSFSGMFWLVAVEWQLCLLFPALMAILNRVGPAQIGLLVALILGTRILGYMQGLEPVHGTHSQLLGRADQFMLGMLAGWFHAKNRLRPIGQYLLPPAVGLVLLGGLALNRLGGSPHEDWLRLFTPALEGAVWAGLITGYVAVLECVEQRRNGISWCLAALGRRSHSICLWHAAFIQLQLTNGWVPRWVAQHELNAVLVVTLTTLPAVVIFSSLSYRVLERPFLPAGERYLGKAETAVLV